MTKINFDFNNAVGRINPMHAIDQPPLAGRFPSFVPYWHESDS